jgi:hypothetical protein
MVSLLNVTAEAAMAASRITISGRIKDKREGELFIIRFELTESDLLVTGLGLLALQD